MQICKTGNGTDNAQRLNLVAGFALDEQMTYPWDNPLTSRGEGVTLGSVWNDFILKQEISTRQLQT